MENNSDKPENHIVQIIEDLRCRLLNAQPEIIRDPREGFYVYSHILTSLTDIILRMDSDIKTANQTAKRLKDDMIYLYEKTLIIEGTRTNVKKMQRELELLQIKTEETEKKLRKKIKKCRKKKRIKSAPPPGKISTATPAPNPLTT